MDEIFVPHRHAPLQLISCTPLNGLAHLPPVMARQLSQLAIKHAKMPAHTHTESGLVEPMLDVFEIKHLFFSPILQPAGSNQ